MEQAFADALPLTAAALEGEVWRLWTGHVAHWSVSHLLLNLLAAVPVLVIVRQRWKLFWWGVAVAPLISLALLLIVPTIEYRGASALVLGGWIHAGLVELRGGAERRFSLVLIALAALKLLAETFGMIPWSLGVESSLAAHWLGATAGLAGGLQFSRAELRSMLEIED